MIRTINNAEYCEERTCSRSYWSVHISSADLLLRFLSLGDDCWRRCCVLTRGGAAVRQVGSRPTHVRAGLLCQNFYRHVWLTWRKMLVSVITEFNRRHRRTFSLSTDTASRSSMHRLRYDLSVTAGRTRPARSRCGAYSLQPSDSQRWLSCVYRLYNHLSKNFWIFIICVRPRYIISLQPPFWHGETIWCCYFGRTLARSLFNLVTTHVLHLWSLLLAHLATRLWKSQIAPLGMLHPLYGMNSPLISASLVRHSLRHFHPSHMAVHHFHRIHYYH